ncbi:uncharacterized protein [Watersipora subatra]|uniref:uncharacterized protein n=1 Tax=Watersipora subatra TaxID=2589382 RepID=UPI00355B034B
MSGNGLDSDQLSEPSQNTEQIDDSGQSEILVAVVSQSELLDENPESASDAADSIVGADQQRRSQRETKLSLKARENRCLELSHSLLQNMSEQLHKNEEFLRHADSQLYQTVEAFLTDLDKNTAVIHSQFNELQKVSEVQPDVNVTALYEQYRADVSIMFEYGARRREEEMHDREEERRVQELEQAVEESRRKLEEDMKVMTAMMEARRARMQTLLQQQTTSPVDMRRFSSPSIHTSTQSAHAVTAQVQQASTVSTHAAPAQVQQASTVSTLAAPPHVRSTLAASTRELQTSTVPTSAASPPVELAHAALMPTVSTHVQQTHTWPTHVQPTQTVSAYAAPLHAPQAGAPIISTPSAQAFIPKTPSLVTKPYPYVPNGSPYQSSMTESHPAEVAKAITDHMHISLIAPPEPGVFTGDPLQYADWRVAYNYLIGARAGSPIEKLHRLRKYVDGEAKETISGYFRLQTEDAYQEALQTLDEEFGRPDLVEDGFRDKLESWPKIGKFDKDALKKYSIFLKQCVAAQSSLNNLKVLSDKRENKKFIKCLPEWVANRWLTIVTEEEEKQGFPPFSRYASFVAFQAKVSNNSLRESGESANHKGKNDSADAYHHKTRQGQRSSEGASKGKRQFGEAPAKTSQINAHQTSTQAATNCLYCKKGRHKTTECRSLTKLPYKDKCSFVTENKLCFRCLNSGHHKKECKSNVTCNTCNNTHPTAFHFIPRDKSTAENDTKGSSADKKDDSNERTDGKPKALNANAIKQQSQKLLSMIVPVFVTHNNKQELVYALLDSQSDASFISKDIAEKITPTYTQEDVTIRTLNGETTKKLKRYNLLLKGFGAANLEQLKISAYEQDDIPCNTAQIPNRNHVRNMPHLRSIERNLPPKLDIPVALLIGTDCSQALMPRETISGADGLPFAIKTLFGWTLCGQVSECNHVQHVHTTALCKEEHNLSRMSQNDMKFLELLNDGLTKLENGSVSLPLPFKEEPQLPNNKIQAERRFEQLLKRFRKDEAYKAEYCTFMKELISNNHAELAPSNTKDKETWYIPHFGVYHPKKKKLRIVFDASAKHMGKSLNELLLTGPDQMNNLVGILLRFRQNTIALSCDVQKMFHNFIVAPEHRDFLRFLWRDDATEQIVEYRMTRHLFGATSSPGVATFALRKIASEHKEDKPEAWKFITENFYVDDGIMSTEAIEDAIKLVKDTIEVCSSANLRLHKFVSNSRKLLNTIPISERASEVQGLDLLKDKLPTERTLGLEWCSNSDTIMFKNSMTTKPFTKRGILSVISQLYDPLGLLAPFTLLGKNIMQKACQSSVEWDEEVPSDIKTEWMTWMESLSDLEKLKISRCIKPPEFGEIARTELHHFCDGSLSGYGACSYVRFTNKQQQVHVALLIAKSRVVPLKSTMTVPRLELQAAVEAAHLSNVLRSELQMDVNAEFFWSDSQITLGRIKNSNARYHMFVANRVKEIRSLSRPDQWFFIAGSMNPADIVSRGSRVKDLQQFRWWEGPEFLQTSNITPLSGDQTDYQQVADEDPELKHVKTALQCQSKEMKVAENIFSKFSSWKSLVRAIANCKKMISNKCWKKPILTVDDLKETEKVIIKMAQLEAYEQDIKHINKGTTWKQSSIAKLNPYLDPDQLLRIGGRVKNSTALSLPERHPLIIPKNTHIAKLLVRYYHQKVYHQGRTTTLGALRGAGYWVIRGNKLVKDAIYECVVCKRLRGKTADQQMGDLPKERTEPGYPFTHVGIDCFGPYTVKDRRTEAKRWGLIFVCLYSKGIHIELLEQMSTDAFLNALRCFMCIRGPVSTIYCDQGTNFIGARNELEKQLECISQEARNKVKDDMIKFKFNAPSASHTGGLWERSIKTVKAVLNGMTQTFKGRLDTPSLRTAFYEAMYTVNSRPLATDNLTNPSETFITPNHLLTAKPQTLSTAPGDFDNQEIYGRKQWRKVQQFANIFWEQWKVDYLCTLDTRQKWQSKCQNLVEGDIVLLTDDNTPRNQWRTGVIEETFPGKDNLVRRVKIRLTNRMLDRKGKQMEAASVLERPVQKLVLLLPAKRD